MLMMQRGVRMTPSPRNGVHHGRWKLSPNPCARIRRGANNPRGSASFRLMGVAASWALADDSPSYGRWRGGMPIRSSSFEPEEIDITLNHVVVPEKAFRIPPASPPPIKFAVEEPAGILVTASRATAIARTALPPLPLCSGSFLVAFSADTVFGHAFVWMPSSAAGTAVASAKATPSSAPVARPAAASRQAPLCRGRTTRVCDHGRRRSQADAAALRRRTLPERALPTGSPSSCCRTRLIRRP